MLPSRRACASSRFSPETQQTPLATVELLWHETAGLDDIDTDELLQRLFRLSLLLAARPRPPLPTAPRRHPRLAARPLRCHGFSRRRTVPRWRLSRPLRRRVAPARRPIRAGLPCSMHLRAVDAAEFGGRCCSTRAGWRANCGPGVAALIDDYSGTDDLRLVGDALRLSAHVLGRDPSQLAAQLAAASAAAKRSATASWITVRSALPCTGRSLLLRSATPRLSRRKHPQTWRVAPSYALSKAMPAPLTPWPCCPTASAPSPPPRTRPSSSGI